MAVEVIALWLEKDMEFRIPHILLVGLFYSILMMFIAENLLP